MSQALLEIDGLRVDYADVTAVRDVSLTVPGGEVCGLIGPNGAGKTSMMKAVSGLVEPTYGTVRLCGESVQDEPRRALVRLGFMPDFPPVYDGLTAREFLRTFASAYGLPRDDRHRHVDGVLHQVGLVDSADHDAGGFSRGMKQRLFLAKTLLHEPDVIVLDEPASGLDPEAREELAGVLRGLGEAGKAVLVSSHILAEMQEFCTSVAIVEEGSLLVAGRVEDVVADVQPERAMRLALLHEVPELVQWLATVPGVSTIEARGPEVSFSLEGDENAAAELLAELARRGAPLYEFSTREQRLTDLFQEVRSRRSA